METKFKVGDPVRLRPKAQVNGIPKEDVLEEGVGWVTHANAGNNVIEVQLLGARSAWWYVEKDLEKATIPEEGGSHCHAYEEAV